MAISIIGRKKEKEKLDQILRSNQAEFLAIYGRRRVGKTFLVRQHLKDAIVFELAGTKEGAKEQQLLNFFGEYLRRTGREKETQAPRSWHHPAAECSPASSEGLSFSSLPASPKRGRGGVGGAGCQWLA